MKDTHFIVGLVCVTISLCLTMAIMTTEFVKSDVLDRK